MPRHGSCSPRTLRSSVAAALKLTLVMTLTIAGQITSAVHAQSETQPVTIRIQWGGGQPRTWSGQLQVDSGTIVSAQPLSLSVDGPVNTLPRDNRVVIDHWQASEFGGVDLTLEVAPDTRIALALENAEDPDLRLQRAFEISSILSQPALLKLDASGNQLSLERSVSDQIAVDIQRDNLVFTSGETIAFAWAPNRAQLNSDSITGKLHLRRSASNSTILHSEIYSFELDGSGSAPLQNVEFKLPEQEGVYQIELSVSNSWSPLSGRQRSVRRLIELVVLEEQAREPGNEDWRMMTEIDLAKEAFPSGVENLWARWNRFRVFGDQIQQYPEPVSSVGTQALVRILPAGWLAIPVEFKTPGQPHMIEIEFLDQPETSATVSLVELDERGQPRPLGVDAGIEIPSTASDRSALTSHRMMTWPQSRQAFVVIKNQNAAGNVTLGKLGIKLGGKRLPVTDRHTNPIESDTRQYMAFLDQPILADMFGIQGSLDPGYGERLDDWQSIYHASDQLVQWLKSEGYSGMYLTVMADGSTLYPSDHVRPTPRYDSGILFADRRDPYRKDVVAMLYRMFEREGLSLIPVFRFNAPLPDASLPQVPAQLIDFNQEVQRRKIDERLPVYNPLDREVQHAVKQVIDEFVDRYGHQPAYRGLALTLAPDCYTLLPGSRWGYDSTTVRRFAQQHPEVRLDNDWQSVRSQLLETFRPQWFQWRTAEMTAWYQSLGESVCRDRSDVSLVLAPVDLYQNRELAAALTPSLYRYPEVAEVMESFGLSAQLTQSSSAERPQPIKFLAPHRLALDRTLAQERVSYSMEQSSRMKDWWRQMGAAGDLFDHRSSWFELDGLRTHPDFLRITSQTSPLLRRQSLRRGGAAACQSWSQALKDRDSQVLIDGGDYLSLMQRPATEAWLRVYRQLPARSFVDVPTKASDPAALPLAVRQWKGTQATTFYCVNASPWPLKVQLVSHSTSRREIPVINWFDDSQLTLNSPTETRSTGSISFTVTREIPPFGLIGGRLPAGVQLDSFGFALPEETGKQLRRRVLGLQTRLSKAQQALPMNVLTNGNFEREPHRPLNGWTIGSQPAESFRIRSTDLEAGSAETGLIAKRYLEISNQSNGAAWVRSNLIDVPESGRLSISAWLRTPDRNLQPALRISVEGKTEQGSYYRFGSVGQLSPQPDQNQIETDWKRFAVHFDDLPDGVTELRIGFDLMDAGVVHVTQVDVYDHWFDDNDAKVITQMLASTDALLLQAETYERCRRLLESYWARFLDHYVPEETEVTRSDPSAVQPSPDAERTGQLESRSVNNRSQRDNSGNKVPMFRRFRGWRR